MLRLKQQEYGEESMWKWRKGQEGHDRGKGRGDKGWMAGWVAGWLAGWAGLDLAGLGGWTGLG